MGWPRLNRFEGFSSFSEIQIRYRETTLSCTGDRVACASRGAAGGDGAQRSTINDNVRLKYVLVFYPEYFYLLTSTTYATSTTALYILASVKYKDFQNRSTPGGFRRAKPAGALRFLTEQVTHHASTLLYIYTFEFVLAGPPTRRGCSV